MIALRGLDLRLLAFMLPAAGMLRNYEEALWLPDWAAATPFRFLESAFPLARE